MEFIRHCSVLRYLRLNNVLSNNETRYISRFCEQRCRNVENSVENPNNIANASQSVTKTIPIPPISSKENPPQNVMQITENVNISLNKHVSNVVDVNSSDQVEKDELERVNCDDQLVVSETNNTLSTKSLSESTDIQNIDRLVKDDSQVSISANSTMTEGLISEQIISKDLEEFIDEIETPNPLEPCNEDLSHIKPYANASFNIAKFANESETIQEFVKLGVELYKIEKKYLDLAQWLLRSNFKRDIQPYLMFLNDCGVLPTDLGRVITKNPMIFKEDIENLWIKIRYFRAHKFSGEMISRIITLDSRCLLCKVNVIDERLGYFQNVFKLNGNEVRKLVVTLPKLITYSLFHIKQNTFAVKEDMGFDELQMKSILLNAPRVWIKSRRNIVESFEYLHDEMKIPRELIALEPRVLLSGKKRIERRHKFLVELKKAQYDPEKPLYTAPLTILLGSDAEFCANVAKTDVHVYNEFLKTF